MGARERLGLTAMLLALALVAAVTGASADLPTGWDIDPESLPTATTPPTTTPTATDQPPGETAWPVPPSDEPEGTDWITKAATDSEPRASDEGTESEGEPELTAAELDIVNALQPTCDDPWTKNFFVISFPQPDEVVMFHDDFGVDRPDD